MSFNDQDGKPYPIPGTLTPVTRHEIELALDTAIQAWNFQQRRAISPALIADATRAALAAHLAALVARWLAVKP